MSLTITPAEIRAWSMMGTRGTFGVTLLKLAEENPALVGLTADLAITSGMERFSSTYPARFFNLGIAEQNLIGVAAGMASQGLVPFATTFANFAALRACEQMRHYLGYLQENVKVVGLASGFAMGMFGTTHYGIEDIATLRAISGLTILSPADATATAQLTELAARHHGPVYLRLTGGMRTPVVYREQAVFELGKAMRLREGDDIALVATGSMVAVALKAADALEAHGLRCAVVDMHTIKPLDTDTLKSLFGSRLLVTLEEHSVVGGLGGAVAEYLAEQGGAPRLLRLGIPQGYGPAGEYAWMLEQCGLTAPQVTQQILDAVL
ncbi:transketolase [Cronobacter turicensis]|uniref:transketolase family protein n=1 Tax=Cronobacter turicensis TaxID=413502 RepID=UPI001413568F|nr:transketolase C-terminal domain-containing protein [Cronobacter turicensis]NHV08117.1 transketolase [Cronobacter turicensis]NHV62997.1 transketolase [Cronobacter turicensis]NHW09938.1 transketolase [Cronobacter turicensis]